MGMPEWQSWVAFTPAARSFNTAWSGAWTGTWTRMNGQCKCKCTLMLYNLHMNTYSYSYEPIDLCYVGLENICIYPYTGCHTNLSMILWVWQATKFWAVVAFTEAILYGTMYHQTSNISHTKFQNLRHKCKLYYLATSWESTYETNNRRVNLVHMNRWDAHETKIILWYSPNFSSDPEISKWLSQRILVKSSSQIAHTMVTRIWSFLRVACCTNHRIPLRIVQRTVQRSGGGFPFRPHDCICDPIWPMFIYIYRWHNLKLHSEAPLYVIKFFTAPCTALTAGTN